MPFRGFNDDLDFGSNFGGGEPFDQRILRGRDDRGQVPLDCPEGTVPRRVGGRWSCEPLNEGGPPGAGGGQPPDLNCEPWQTAYNSPVRGWVCVGNKPGTGGGASGGGGGGGGGGFRYTPPPWTGGDRPEYDIPPVPGFDSPEFTAPDADAVYADPSYQFRLQQGQGALEASAAARGVLRSGNTLQGILEYGQNFASQEYGNVYARKLGEYDRQFRSALAEYAPRLEEWQTLAGAEIGAGNLAFQAALDRYFFGINDQFRREKMIFDAGLS